MVSTTAQLLQRQGYHATGLDQIVAESRSPKGSMYFHFPGGKEQLAAEAIAYAGRRLREGLRAHHSGTTLASLDAYLVTAEHYLEGSNFERGCPIATVALEVGTASPAVGQACSEAFDGLQHEIAEWLAADGLPPAEAMDTAMLVTIALEGALVLAKATRSVAPIEALRSHFPRLIPVAPAAS